MDTIDFPRFILAFILVLGLIGLLAWVFKRYGNTAKMFLGAKEEGTRLQVVETRYLDAKHRLVLVKRDDKEYLLLLGDGGNLVVEGRDKNE